MEEQLRRAGITRRAYLNAARRAAQRTGYPAKNIHFSTDAVHKLETRDEEGRIRRFGRVGYGDFILWTHLERARKVPRGYANEKRRLYRARATEIKGDWAKDKYSANNLAINILW